MGFLTSAAKEEDAESEDDGLEEQYMRLMPKIGRDFVHKDDINLLIRALLITIDPLNLLSLELQDSEARGRAQEYKSMLDNNKKGNDVYKDLINLDD